MKLFITKVSTVFEVTVCKSTNKPLLELILDERYETKRERERERSRENERNGSRIKWWFHLESWRWKSTKEVQVRYLSLLLFTLTNSYREKKKGENGSKLHRKRSSTAVFDLQQNVDLRKLLFAFLCYVGMYVSYYVLCMHSYTTMFAYIYQPLGTF